MLYIGDRIKLNGPSIVDVSLIKEIVKCQDINLDFLQANSRRDLIKTIFCLYQYDIIHVSAVSFGGLVIVLLAYLGNKKSFFLAHGLLKAEKRYRKIKWLRLFEEIVILKLSTYVLVVSDQLKQLTLQQYDLKPAKVLTQYNGINFDIIRPSKRMTAKNEPISFVTVGGGRPEKGVLKLCEAIEMFSEVNIELFVVGEVGDHIDKIKGYNFVNYLGFISQNQLIELLFKTDFFIQNSHYEPFGMAPLEAVIAGCNIIVSKKTGFLTILDLSEDYWICDPADTNSIHKAIISTLKKPNNTAVLGMLISKKEELSWSNRGRQLINRWKG